jgi:hypothetical protein
MKIMSSKINYLKNHHHHYAVNLWVFFVPTILILLIILYITLVPLEHFEAAAGAAGAEEECVDENNQIQKIKKTASLTAATGAAEEEREVFLIYNKYNYQEATDVCKVLFNGRLATKKDLDDAFKKGANWCSWGWLEGQAVGFPVQKDYWTKTNGASKGFCGPTAGLNIIESMDPLKKYYVTCYGLKPSQGKKDKVVHASIEKKVESTASSLQRDIAQCKMAKATKAHQQWAKEQKQKVRILQFNSTNWSRREIAAAAAAEKNKPKPQKKGWFS